VAEPVGQRDEIAFRVDDGLLHVRRALLQEAAQKMRLARAGIALDQEPGREQLLQIDEGWRAARPRPDLDPHLHPGSVSSCSVPVV
jgi:hypothetical protein